MLNEKIYFDVISSKKESKDSCHDDYNPYEYSENELMERVREKWQAFVPARRERIRGTNFVYVPQREFCLTKASSKKYYILNIGA